MNVTWTHWKLNVKNLSFKVDNYLQETIMILINLLVRFLA